MKIKLIEEIEHKNGDATFSFDIDDEFKQVVKKTYNSKKYTNKLGKKFLIEAIYKALKDKFNQELDEGYIKAKQLNGIK